MKTKGKRDETSPGIGFHEWELDAMEALRDIFEEGVMEKFKSALDDVLEEGFKIATDEYQCMAWFMGDDLLTIAVDIPIGGNDDGNPRWKFNLVDLVDGEIEGTECLDGKIDEADARSLATLRDSLQVLVYRIDKKLAETEVRKVTPEKEEMQ